MKPRSLLVVSLAALAGCGTYYGDATSEGLRPVYSSQLDELYLHPSADLGRFRKVTVEPVQVELHRDYLAQKHAYNRLQPMYPPYHHPAEVAKHMGAELRLALADAFKGAGYEVVDGPQADAVRIEAKISELFINAPDRIGPEPGFLLAREAGQATLSLQATDAASGMVLARVVHRAKARQARRISVSNDVSNQLWLDSMLRRWAVHCVGALGAARRTEISLANY